MRRYDRGLRRECAERRALEPRRQDRPREHRKFESSRVPACILAQTSGGLLGGVLVWLTYLPHRPPTEDKGAKLAVFCTGPAVRRPSANLLSEAIATAALVIGLLSVLTPGNLVPNSGFEAAFALLLVGVIVFAIGLSLGGSTGYAINPARDLGPPARALTPADSRQGDVRLGLRVGAGHRPDHRRRRRRLGLRRALDRLKSLV
jgi:glycerol uptake facilitator-like aquaporin